MKLRTTLYSFAAVLLLGSTFLAGCTTEDEPGTSGDGTTGVKASTGTNHMTVTGLSDAQLYIFAVRGGTGTLKGLSSNGSGSIVVTWNGTIDSIYYKKADATTTSFVAGGTTYTVGATTNSAQIWATAMKFGPVTIGEDSKDTTGALGSGLLISGTGATVVSTKFGADVNNFDFKLRTDNTLTAPWLVLEPGIRNNINDTRVAQMANASDIYVVNEGANRDNYNSGFNTQTTFNSNNFWTVPAVDLLNGGAPYALGDNAMIPITVTQSDGVHYGRIEVISAVNFNNVNGMWHEPTDPQGQRTITVNVYYQTVAGWDYAKAHEAGNSGH
ncbi:MAG TPA: hypothetical protein VFO76_06565 [Candidatus Kapabacteria bacterium]|nr:hypothetical protein [Candidatus Kapabacteria bacterium]